MKRGPVVPGLNRGGNGWWLRFSALLSGFGYWLSLYLGWLALRNGSGMEVCVDKHLRTQTIPRSDCPWCGKSHNATTGPGEAAEGDITICIDCTGLAAFDKDLKRRKLTDQEMEEIKDDPELKQMLDAVRGRMM